MGAVATAALCLLLAGGQTARAQQFRTLPDTADRSPDVSELRARTAQGCWDACVTNRECGSADYRARTGTCWLKSDALVDTRVPAPGIDGLLPDFLATQNTANVEPDLAKVLADTTVSCWAACMAYPGCVSADFRRRTRDCWLKDSLTATLRSAPGIERLTASPDRGGTLGSGSGTLRPNDRVAVSADGNFSDEDDIGATPMTLALLAAGGALDRLVYYGYRNHVWPAETKAALRTFKGRTQDERMRAAVTEGIDVFDLDRALFVDEKARYESGAFPAPELVAAIEASTADSRLWILAAGPMYTVYAALLAADAAKLRYVDLVSHSWPNNAHAERHRPGVDWETLKRLVVGAGGRVHYGGACRANPCVPVTFAKPRDQNAGLDFRRADDPVSAWTWLRDSGDPRLAFVFDKIVDSNVYDVSDAGMAYYMLTGNDRTGTDELRAFLIRRDTAADGADFAELTRRVANASPADVLRGRYADSVAVDGECYCLSNFDHGVGDLPAPGAPQLTVREACAMIGPPPAGDRSEWTFYNTVRCGHDPVNSQIDERQCPGEVGAGVAGCARKGPVWNVPHAAPGPSVADFVHRPAVFRSADLRFTFESDPAPGMRSWRQCVQKCIDRYGAECLYVQFDQLTPDGTCIISRPCRTGDVCSRVRDVNKSGLDYNRVNCKRAEYLAVQGAVDAGVPACENVF